MKPIYPICAAFIVSTLLIACKKRVHPAPQPIPAADFREKYTGVFNLSGRSMYITHPSGGARNVNDNSFKAVLTVSYNPGDSIDNHNTNPWSKLPAVTFRYDNGSQFLMGVDLAGRLYRKANPNANNYGGYMGVDSIYHAYQQYSTSTSVIDSISGRRQ